MPKIKLFLWKTFHEALPVGEALLARHIQVWNSAPVFPAIEISGSLDLELKNLWTSLCSRKSLPPTGVVLGCLAPWIAWQLWVARNQLVFNNRIIKVEEVIFKAIASAREWGHSQGCTTQTSKPAIYSQSASTPGITETKRVMMSSERSKEKKRSICRRLGKYIKEQKGRIYIIRRCVVMLLCWHD
ncbi:PREDICTED: uncharacterized protein LOC106329688 [Brassica oleracea var. oleracea]|nr:PREDICTED: uncharacterized protein LOC106329688 [Brassica oleracea var. oleracea]